VRVVTIEAREVFLPVYSGPHSELHATNQRLSQSIHPKYHKSALPGSSLNTTHLPVIAFTKNTKILPSNSGVLGLLGKGKPSLGLTTTEKEP
jgi:hypothetical protein